MKKITSLILALALTASAMAQHPALGGGDGTSAATAYLIADTTHLRELADWLNTSASSVSGVYYQLMNDLDMSPYSAGDGWMPIGLLRNFEGNFDGNGKVVRNLTVNQPTGNVGLFNGIEGATIENLGIEGCNITGNGAAGGLVGYSGNSTITNCYVTGTVSGTQYVGGLVGYNDNSTLTNCHAESTVSGASGNAGGLVGINLSNSVITNCYAAGTVSGTGSAVGGLVGYQENATITASFSRANVSGTSFVGGLLGWAANESSIITNCYATGNVSGAGNGIGGLAGYSGTVSYCYATGNVKNTGSGNHEAGGLFGSIDRSISNCIAANDTVSSISNYNNRIYGWDGYGGGGEIRANLYALEDIVVLRNGNPASITPNLNGAAGANAEMDSLISENFYTNAENWADEAWDFSVWEICDGKSLPRLRWENVDCETMVIAVANIAGIPTLVRTGTPLALEATVQPAHATNKTIVWSISNDGGTNATINNNELTIPSDGTVELTATIANGLAIGTPYIQTFSVEAATVDEITLTWEATTSQKTFYISVTVNEPFIVNWGDGTTANHTGTGTYQNISKTYTTAGTYTVSIIGHSGNAKFIGFDCEVQQVTDLNVSGSPSLEKLECNDNQLTALDVSSNTALKELYCFGNQLAALNVSQNTALTNLNCQDNELSALDISQNVNLKELFCVNNQLTSLDVSNNPALVWLGCADNQLTTLNVTQNPLLRALGCRGNLLTSLNVSQNPLLETLNISENLFTQMDISQNTALIKFNCWDNQITALNVSANTALTQLSCDNNLLTSLDVSQNVNLMNLTCSNNQLATLNVSANTELVDLRCFNNLLTALDITANTKLRHLNVNNNQLTALTGIGTTALTYIATYNNSLPLSTLYAASEKVSNVTNKPLGTQTLPKKVVNTGSIADFSAEATLGSTGTLFVLTKNGSAAVVNTDYTLSGGILTFLLAGDYVVTMTNSAITSHASYPVQVIAEYEVILQGDFIPVTDIIGVPTTAVARTPLTLTATVTPETATSKVIVWSVKYQGTTGATISGNTLLNTTTAGTVTLTATIADGTAIGTPFAKDFVIQVSSGIVPVTNISGIADTATAGTDLTLSGTVEPSNATKKDIVWSIKDADETGAQIIGGNVFRATAAGTAIVLATIIEGITEGENYTQEFTIRVGANPSSISEFSVLSCQFIRIQRKAN
jgi:hypothetical protein